MTITNYTSTKRELLKRLVELMGGNITGDMGRGTKFVVAARKDGKKVESAVKWHIPVINHKWLYECWIQWSFVDPVNYEPGHLFPPGLNFQETMMSDMPENAVTMWANSEGARKNKAKSLLFLKLAREQQQQADVGGSDGAADMDHSNKQSTVKPPTSTPGMIEDELLPNKSSAPSSRKDAKVGKPKARPSATEADAEQIPSSVPRSTTYQRPPPGSTNDIEPPSSGSKRKASVLGAEKSKANALDMNRHEQEKKRRRTSAAEEEEENDGQPPPPISASKAQGKGKKAASEPDPQETEEEEEDVDEQLPPAGSYSSYRTGAKSKSSTTARKTVDGQAPKKPSASTARKTGELYPDTRLRKILRMMLMPDLHTSATHTFC